MLDDTAHSAREIFLEAIEKHQPHEWLTFLKSACNGDESIQRRVAVLLKGYGESGSFMACPATAFLTEIFDLPPEFENPAHTISEIGRFRLIERIGSGGFGVVYLAEDPVLQRRVAIKIPRPETVSTADLQRRFVRESQIAAQLMHPHLVSIHEAGQAGSVSYQVTSFCAGGTLASWLRSDEVPTRLAIDQPDTGGSRKSHTSPQRQLPIAVAVELLMGLAEGVHYAHERGILHRDLKPSNILLHPKWDLSGKESRTSEPLSSTGNASLPPLESIAEGDSILPGSVPLDQLCKLFQPMISDFGLAKFYDETEIAAPSQTSGETTSARQTSLMGTPEYMAPEQLNGQLGIIGPATDIYGLGAVLYEVLAGQPVFPHGSFPPIRNSVVRQTPPRLRQLRPEVPRDLEAICLKCLAKSPSQRYSSAKQLAEDLESFLRNQPVTARSWSLHERLFNWTRGRPAVATLSLVAGSLSLGLICFGVWHLYQLNELNFKLVSTIQERELQTSVARHARSIAVEQAKIAQEQSDLANQQSYRSEELAWLAGQREYAANMWRAAEHHQKRQLSSMGTVLQEFIPRFDSRSNDVVSIRRSEPAGTGAAYRVPEFTGPEDSRGFEWYYLWNQGLNLLELKGHSESIVDAALTPDGRVCFSVGQDGTVRRWDPKTASLLQTWSLGEPATRHQARISRDATRAIIARNIAEQHLWEVLAWD
ncbi:protein kinase domain-containing protein, partial [Schlesneria sp.]|uniref:WD40 repeat domain-containing serine/threonine protein kinase n=1 Tax=Schlesneria sp. TaxID=2762018 RepID=UPI003F815255